MSSSESLNHPPQTSKNCTILIILLQLLQELHPLPLQLILTQLSLLDRLIWRRSLLAPWRWRWISAPSWPEPCVLYRYGSGDGVVDADLLGGDADRMGEAARLAGEGEREGVPFLLFLLHNHDDIIWWPDWIEGSRGLLFTISIPQGKHQNQDPKFNQHHKNTTERHQIQQM